MKVKGKTKAKVKDVHTLTHTIFRGTIVSVFLSVRPGAGCNVVLYRTGNNWNWIPWWSNTLQSKTIELMSGCALRGVILEQHYISWHYEWNSKIRLTVLLNCVPIHRVTAQGRHAFVSSMEDVRAIQQCNPRIMGMALSLPPVIRPTLRVIPRHICSSIAA